MAVNGEDVKDAPREHVIQLVRSCEHQASLLVCQPETLPASPGRKSTLLSPGRKEKLRTKRPSRVRFAESVCVNGAPLFPVSGQPCTKVYSYKTINISGVLMFLVVCVFLVGFSYISHPIQFSLVVRTKPALTCILSIFHGIPIENNSL